MKNKLVGGLLCFLILGLVACKPVQPGKKEIAQLFKENPDLVMDVLRENKGELFRLMQEGEVEAKSDSMRDQILKFLENPLKPTMDPTRKARGQENAPVTIVDYTDFQCPYCAKGSETMRQLREKYGDKLKIYYKHNPLDFHPEAMPAALYYEALAKQDYAKAWQFHDLIFKDQSVLKQGEAGLVKVAEKLNANVGMLKQDIKDPSLRERIMSDKSEAASFGFNGTPAYLINGVPVMGAYPIDVFSGIIDTILSR